MGDARMVAAAAQGFVLGLSAGAYCAGACLPVLVPYLVSAECRSLGAQARVVAVFGAGRLIGYSVLTVLALAVGPQLVQTELGRVALGVGALGLAALMLRDGIRRNFLSRPECSSGCQPNGRFSLSAGLCTGLRACPPLWLCLAGIVAQRDLLAGATTGLAFVLTTSLFLVPLAFTGFLSAIKSLKEAADVAVLVAGVWFAVSGVATIVGGCAPQQAAPPTMQANPRPRAANAEAAALVAPKFPPNCAGWRLVGEPTAYDAETIYDYMDGAADAYMRYALRQLYVGEYNKGRGKIVAEVYDLTSGPEAFGMFRTDLTGEVVAAGEEARYAKGLVRGRQGRYFLRLEAFPPQKDVLVVLARHLAAALGPNGEKPALLARLPLRELSADAIQFFHEKDDLNNSHYLSTSNVLHLGPETDCLLADCRLREQTFKLLLVQYPTAEQCQQALGDFAQTILAVSAKPDQTECSGQQENGKTAAARVLSDPKSPLLAIVLEADSPETCRAALDLLTPKSP